MTAPTYLGPPAHTSPGDNLPVTRIVIHGTVSPCVPGGAHNVARYFRSQGAGGSAHYVVDPSTTVQVARDNVVCWHAPPNQHSLGVELCDPQTGKASRWSDANHVAMLIRAADLVADLCKKYNVPIVKLGGADVRDGERGICGHVNVSHAFGQSTHTDPGPDFPWGHFLNLVEDATRPPKPPTLWMKGPKHPEWTRKAQVALHVAPSGVFTKATRTAVRAYRRKHKIRPYSLGVIGPKVWALLLPKGK